MASGIKLTRKDPLYPFEANRGEAHRLVVAADFPLDMEAEIFLHQLTPIAGPDAEPQPEFVGVATLADMEAYPRYEPDLSVGPYFRLAEVDVVLPNPEVADELYDSIYSAAANLVSALNSQVALDLTTSSYVGESFS